MTLFYSHCRNSWHNNNKHYNNYYSRKVTETKDVEEAEAIKEEVKEEDETVEEVAEHRDYVIHDFTAGHMVHVHTLVLIA